MSHKQHSEYLILNSKTCSIPFWDWILSVIWVFTQKQTIVGQNIVIIIGF